MTIFLASLALAFPAAMVFAAFSDLLSMTIPNRVPAGLVVVFVLLAFASGMSLPAVGFHVLTGVVALLVTFGCFAAGWMGGGDAKLIAASALWLGPTLPLVDYVFNAAIYGGVLTLGILASRMILAPTTGVAFLDRLLGRETGIPYALALGPAGFIAFWDTPFADLLRAAS